MKTRKIILSLTVLFVTCLFAFSVSATDENTASTQGSPEDIQAARIAEAEKYAYLDLETASDEMKEKILEARNVIIYASDWSGDDNDAFYIDAEGNAEKLPHFSELFPDWDMPVEEETDLDDNATISDEQQPDPDPEYSVVPLEKDDEAAIQPATRSSLSFYVYLNNPSSTVNTNPFYTWSHYGQYIEAYVASLTSSQTCNIGLTNSTTGSSLGFRSMRCKSGSSACS